MKFDYGYLPSREERVSKLQIHNHVTKLTPNTDNPSLKKMTLLIWSQITKYMTWIILQDQQVIF